MLASEVEQYWKELVRRDESQWRLAEAALMYARQMYPDLDVNAYLERLDDFARRVRQDLEPQADIPQRVEAINRLLFDEVGLRGNAENYYEPENSYLNRVLDRKLGIPISLSVIYMDVANQLGLDVQGVNFPSHFLLRVENADSPLIIDAYDGGKQQDNEQLNARLALAYENQAPRIEDMPYLLQPASPREVLVRMLRNLKNIYIQNQQAAEGLAIVELILRLMPESADELRDRGMIYHHLEYTPAALADLNRYLELVSEGPERPAVEALVESLQEQGTSVH